jgi:hypothetical protein
MFPCQPINFPFFIHRITTIITSPMELTFDQAIELLEITNIHQLKIEDIPQLEKTAKKRWHPDKVSHLKNATTTQEYTTKFQQVEWACQMVYSYLQGTYQAGQNFSNSEQRVHEEPEDIIRKNAPDLQNELKNSWDFVKKNRYKWTQEEVLLSDGFKLKDLLHEDFEEDLAMLSVISLFFGTIVLGILTVLGAAINSNVGWFVFGIWVLHAISCLFGFAPLSRFWLPQGLANWMVKFVNLGVSIFNFIQYEAHRSNQIVLRLLVQIPVLFAKLIKYVVLFPLNEIAKIVVGNKVVGVVKQSVNYYAEAAEWYVDALLIKQPHQMNTDELFDLSYLHSELSRAKSDV